jgi:5,6-dimethylbenzimidazole synthase
MNPPIGVRCLIVLVGSPGSGKTTWARRNGRGAVHVSQDGLIDAITPDGFDHAWRSVYSEAEDAVARAGLRAGHTVVVDRTNRTRAHRERWIRIAREESCPAIAVVMSTSEALCRERNAQRDDATRLSESRMERMLSALEPVRSDEGFAAIHFDTGVGDGIALEEILPQADEFANQSPQNSCFSEEERRGLYRAIYERRDVRSHFLPDPIPDAVLGRILDAAHHAPSVGFMQPWDFLVIRDAAVRQEVHRNFESASRHAAGLYQGEQRKLYDGLKLAGILEAPVNLCVTCDHGRPKGSGLGRQSDPAVDLYSTVCAVQNLWLAARAESVGVGWVSILDLDQLKSTLGIPQALTPVAYLCVGYVSEFRPKPDLEEKGWESRGLLASVTHFDHWGVHKEAGVHKKAASE